MRKAASSSMLDESAQLEFMLDYELRSSKRYRRPVSLVMVRPLNAPIKLRHLLGPTLRESDQLFEIHDHAAILMGETDREGALAAIARYKEACEGEIDLRFAVASFPEDGSTVHELLATARQRLNKAVTLEPRAVVAEG
jgi:hypothetical protein